MVVIIKKYTIDEVGDIIIDNGDKFFSITIIQVNAGVDTGNLLIEKIFQINETDTIAELHEIANKNLLQF